MVRMQYGKNAIWQEWQRGWNESMRQVRTSQVLALGKICGKGPEKNDDSLQNEVAQDFNGEGLNLLLDCKTR